MSELCFASTCRDDGKAATVVNHFSFVGSTVTTRAWCTECAQEIRLQVDHWPFDGVTYWHTDGSWDRYLPILRFECGSEGSIALEVAFAALAGVQRWSTFP